MKAILVLALAGPLLASCANRPESIHASYVSHEKYMDLDCAALEAKMGDTRADLAKYSEMQNAKANEDAMGVFLFGIPFSKLSGDVEGEIARLKGEVEAIGTAQIRKKCGASGGSGYVAAPAPNAPGAASASATAALAAPPAPAVAGLLAAGTSWTYRFSDRIYAKNNTWISVRVLRADHKIVEEQVSAGAGAERSATVQREIDARAPRIEAYPLGPQASLLEFSPYLFAAEGESALHNVASVSGYPTYGDVGWATRTKPPTWEQVTVPAGTFKALSLEISGQRSAPILSSVVIQKFWFRVWYAPEAKRYVKLEHRNWVGIDDRLNTDEVIELARFSAPS